MQYKYFIFQDLSQNEPRILCSGKLCIVYHAHAPGWRFGLVPGVPMDYSDSMRQGHPWGLTGGHLCGRRSPAQNAKMSGLVGWSLSARSCRDSPAHAHVNCSTHVYMVNNPDLSVDRGIKVSIL